MTPNIIFSVGAFYRCETGGGGQLKEQDIQRWPVVTNISLVMDFVTAMCVELEPIIVLTKAPPWIVYSRPLFYLLLYKIIGV